MPRHRVTGRHGPSPLISPLMLPANVNPDISFFPSGLIVLSKLSDAVVKNDRA